MAWRSFLDRVRQKQDRVLRSLAQIEPPESGPYAGGLPISYPITAVSFWNQKNAKRLVGLLLEAKVQARIIRDRGRFAVQIRKDQVELGLAIYKSHQSTFVDPPRTSRRTLWDALIVISFMFVLAMAVAFYFEPSVTLSYCSLALSFVFPMAFVFYHGMRFRTCHMFQTPYRFHLIDLIALTGTMAISIAIHKFGLSI